MPDPIRASDVKSQPVEWLWGERIPCGMITVVAGKPNQGKGLFAARVAADVSLAGGKVLYSAIEDDDSKMTRPRLEAAGANLDNILFWEFRLPLNGMELAEFVVDKEIALIVIDPLAAHLSGGISRHSDNVRTVLSPLTKLLEDTGAAVLIVEHALKRVPASGHPLDAIGGSGSGVPAAARAAFVFGVDPDDEDKRILAQAKFNLGPPPKALSFEVDVDDIEDVGEQPFLLLDDELGSFDPMRLFAKKEKGDKIGRPPDKKAAAAEWLTLYLADAGGEAKSSTVQEDAKQHGMAAKTLRRAADDMGIVKNPPGGGRNCKWALPEEVMDLMGLSKPDADIDTEATEATEATDGEVEPIDTKDAAASIDFDALEALFGESG